MTDPRPATDPHGGHFETDPVTGYETTGHDWAGITELNTPVSKFVTVSLALTFAYSVVAWILLPAWPLGRDYTRGLLGLDQTEIAVVGLRELEATRQDWLTRFAEPDFAALEADATLLAEALPAADRLFQDNCAACHGTGGVGGPGFPTLGDADWLWGGEAETIAETLRVGINADHPDTRISEMPSFNWIERADRLALAEYVAALPSGTTDPASPAAALFTENCVACHGELGVGGLTVGAPSLADTSVIYGQDPPTVMMTLLNGRHGVMPSWSGRLSPEEINLLALFVALLPDATGAPDP
jgi:cytochrome c oxidase cbb3-type subunit 3